MLERARCALEHGESVVVDATWLQPRFREQAQQVAVDTASDLIEMRCEAPAAVCDARLAQRIPGATDSDASSAVRSTMAATAPPWPEAVELDTSGPLELTLQPALELLGIPAPRIPQPLVRPSARSYP
jgi:predicted kinase